MRRIAPFGTVRSAMFAYDKRRFDAQTDAEASPITGVRWARAALTACVFAAIAALDYVTGLDLALRALYVFPVGLAGWYLGRAAGVLTALLAAAACVLFDLAGGLTTSRRIFLYSDAATRLLTYLFVVYILDRIQRLNRQLEGFANSDALTGLPNLRGFRDLATRELERCRRNGSPFTLAHVDLDGFKAINDTLGHSEGDRVLVVVARVLGSGRAVDIAARLGGDEFAVLLPSASRTQAETAIARLRAQLAEAMSDRGWKVTASIGVAVFLTLPETVDAALSRADALMYDVKRASKNAVRFVEISAPAA